MVVQCPTCQSKFRIADDKVTDKGVRVRCTSCKNVFQVKKPGAAGEAPGPGSTMDLSQLDAAAIAKPRAAAGRGGVAPAVSAAKPAPPPPAAKPVARAKPATNGARKLDADDLFGMAELTGDAPLEVGRGKSAPPPPKPAAAKPAAKPMPNFDDIDIEVDETPAPPKPAVSKPPPAKAAAKPPPPPLETPAEVAPPPPPPHADEDDLGAAATSQMKLPAEPPPPPAENGVDADGVKLGALKGSPATLRDPFEGMNLTGGHEGGALELSGAPAAKKAEKPASEAKPAPTPVEKQPEPPPPSPSRDMVSSALTGLVGAALAVAVILGAALNEDGSSLWLGLFPGANDIVATRVVSGLYDTVGGKPVFYVRGRVENRSKKLRGPVRVVAELVGDGGPEAHADVIAGAEPTPEDVWSIRTPAEAEKLARSLEMGNVERRIEPGATLPFFAVIADPPADLVSHRLRVRVEPVDAWVPPEKRAPKK